MDLRHQLNCTLYSCAFSPCGKYLAAGSNFGYIVVFDLHKSLRENSDKHRKSIFTFKAHCGLIQSLVTKGGFLVSGGVGPISVWRWNDILDRKPAQVTRLEEPCVANETSFLSNDVNALACYDKKLFAGRDDSIVCVWDMETGTCERKLTGHSDYIHDVSSVPSMNGLVSCSEDGTVKTWDIRTFQPTSTFEPHYQKKLCRPQYGKWLSCVSVSENGQWMACGGGPQLSLWHLRSQTLTAPLEKVDFTPYTVEFRDNLILSGGNGKMLHHWHTNGREKASIPCSTGNVFSIAFDEELDADNQLMTVAGASNRIDIFCNMNYRSHVLLA